MTSSEEHNFENNWRKAFENASEMPPQSVWGRIEAHLDEEDERVTIIPLWQQWRTLKWVAAAGITILLVSLGGWWLTDSGISNTQLTNKENVNNEQSSPSVNSIKNPSNQKENYNVVASKRKIIGKQGKKETIAKVSLRQNADYSISTKTNPSNRAYLSKMNRQKTSLPPLSKEELSIANTQRNANELLQLDPPKRVSESPQIASLSNDNSTTSSNPITISTPVLVLSSLDGKDLRELIGPAKRQPWVVYQMATSEQKVQKIPFKEYWASVGVMPATYNAGINIGGNQNVTAFASSNQGFVNTTQSAPNANRPLFSYALQWQGGIQLAQRWSIETGLNYLQGNSIFEGTNGFNVFSNSYVNNLETAINMGDNPNQRLDFAAISTDKSQIQSLTTSQNINNSYQFLQVPVQAGYAIVKPKRKISLWLLGGLINNIFIRNSFESGQEQIVTVSGHNNPYRKLSFSASTGVRLQYKMNKRWTTLLSGNFQHALGSTTHTTASFEARPQLLGVGAGLRYGF